MMFIIFHILEKIFKWVKNKYNFKILKINIPIEIYYIKNNFLQKNYFQLFFIFIYNIRIFNRKNVLLNMKVENKKILWIKNPVCF